MVPGQWVQRSARGASRAAIVVATALITAACSDPDRPVSPTATAAVPSKPSLTPGQGSTPTNLGQATYWHSQQVRRTSGDWEVGLEAKGGLEVVVRSFAYDVGSFTGWHKHPGPVLIQVIEGTVTFFEADDPCTPIVVSAGHGYLDTGEEGHIGRNLSGMPAKDLTIYLAPPGTQVSQLRIDIPEPAGAAACSH